MLRKVISILICISFIFQQPCLAAGITELDISTHLAAMRNSFVSDTFRPLHLRYLAYDALNNSFRLLLEKGDQRTTGGDELKNTTKTLLNYFFIGLSLPNDSFWVNLRPDSPDNIIDSLLARTDLGKIFLEADLQLKKDTANFTSPQTPEGKLYWDKLYKKAEELYGYQEVTIPTLTRPWIVPNEIIVRESKESAYIYKATLKVMLEQDYLKDSSTYSFKDSRAKALNEYSSQLIRESIIPKLTKEVNTSKRYAALRQVYYSLILAQWFKQKSKTNQTGLTGRIDSKDLKGLTSTVAWDKNRYFKEYQKSFQQGEYSMRGLIYTPYGQNIRSYFSGGVACGVIPINFIASQQSLIPITSHNLGLLAQGEPGAIEVKVNDGTTAKINIYPTYSSSPINTVFTQQMNQAVEECYKVTWFYSEIGTKEDIGGYPYPYKESVKAAVFLSWGLGRNFKCVPLMSYTKREVLRGGHRGDEWGDTNTYIDDNEGWGLLRNEAKLSVALRGTVQWFIDQPEGYLKLDPPESKEEFLKSKLNVSTLTSEDLDRYETVLINEFIETISFFVSQGMNPNKKLVLADSVKNIFRKHGYLLPKEFDVNQFLNLTQLSHKTVDAKYIEDLLKQEITVWQPGPGDILLWDQEFFKWGGEDPYGCDRMKNEAKDYLASVYQIAPFLNKKQTEILEKRLNVLEQSAKDFTVSYGGLHKGETEEVVAEYSYAEIRDLITRVKNRLMHLPKEKRLIPEELNYRIEGIIPLDDLKINEPVGNKAKSFIVFKKLGLRYPKGVVISIPMVKAILSGNEEALNRIIDMLMRYFQIKEEDATFKITLAVRSSPAFSMPGVLETILDVSSKESLRDAIKKVAFSWNSQKARNYRLSNNISEEPRLGIIIQEMVKEKPSAYFSYSGVVFSRNPDTGEKGLFGTYVEGDSSENVVSGKMRGNSIIELKLIFPQLYDRLKEALEKLEIYIGYPQEIEFINISGNIYFLQTRDVRFSPQQEGFFLGTMIDKLTTIPLLEAFQNRIKKRKIYKLTSDKITYDVLFSSEIYTPGSMEGRIVFTVARAMELANEGENVILVATPEIKKDLLDVMLSIDRVAVITTYGNSSSHEAIIARSEGIPTLINPKGLRIKNSSLEYSVEESGSGKIKIISEGDMVLINNGKVCINIHAPEGGPYLVEVNPTEYMSFGIDITSYREKFVSDFNEAWKNISPTMAYEALLKLNVQKWDEFILSRNQNRVKQVFLANLEKHFLHELLLQKGAELGKSESEIEKELFNKIYRKEEPSSQEKKDEPTALSETEETFLSIFRSLQKLPDNQKWCKDPIIGDARTMEYMYVEGGVLEGYKRDHDETLEVLSVVEKIVDKLDDQKKHLLKDKIEQLANAYDVRLNPAGGHFLDEDSIRQRIETLVDYSDVREIAARINSRLKEKSKIDDNEDNKGRRENAGSSGTMTQSPSNEETKQTDNDIGSSPLGGIDFRALPIVTQAMSNLSASPIGVDRLRLINMNLGQELTEIRKLISAGIIPRAERLKECLASSCLQEKLDDERGIFLSCLAEILRLQESECCLTDSTLRDILVVLEAAPSPQWLKEAFLGKPS